jgi:hypothetical protein
VHQPALTSRAGTVDTVIVNGEVVIHRGRSTRLDEVQVRDQARRSVQRRLVPTGLRASLVWPAIS